MVTRGGSLLALTLAIVAPTAAGAQGFPSDEELTARIRALVADSTSTGIVLGVLERDGSRRVVWHGSGGPDTRPLGPLSLFEIGSINKTFTGILLSEMDARAEVRLFDPVAKYLPTEVKVPSRNGREISLLDLATHRSGLPRMSEHVPADSTNPYADFTVRELYDFLTHYELTRDVGAEFEYSNLGFGLLGHALGRAAGRDYKALVRQRVIDPLGLRSTTFTPDGPLAAWRTAGHDDTGRVVRGWEATDAIAGAGGLWSNAEDLLTYVAANILPPNSRLGVAIHFAQRGRAAEDSVTSVGLAWSMRWMNPTRIVSHAGGTGGFRSFIGFDPYHRVGLVLLSNSTAREGALIRLGYDLLYAAATAGPVSGRSRP